MHGPHILSDVLFQGVNVDENAPEKSLEFVLKVKVCVAETSDGNDKASCSTKLPEWLGPVWPQGHIGPLIFFIQSAELENYYIIMMKLY